MANPNNLIVNKTASLNYVTIGDTITYTVVLQNNGTVSNTGIILTDLIPQGANFVDSSVIINNILQTSPNPALGITLPDLLVGAVHTVSFKAQVVDIPASLPMINTAQLDYQFTTTVPNTASVDSNAVTTTLNAPIIRLNKLAPSIVSVGDSITFNIGVSNAGSTTVNSLQLIDTIPIGTTFIPGSVFINGSPFPGSPAPPSGLTLTNFPASSSFTLTFAVTVVSIPTTGNIINQAYTNSVFTIDPITNRQGTVTNLSNIATIQFNLSTLVNLTKTVNKSIAQTGDTLTYTLDVINQSSSSLNTVTVIDSIPLGTTFIPGSVLVNGSPNAGNIITGIMIGSIPASQTATLSFSVTIANTSPTTLNNSALVQLQVGSSPLTLTFNSNTVTTTIIDKKLSILKSVNQTVSSPGDTLTYTLALTNTGQNALNNIAIVDSIPISTTYVPLSITGSTPFIGDPTTIIRLTNALNAGQNATITFKVSINTSIPIGTTISNIATSTFSATVNGITDTGTSTSNKVNTLVENVTLSALKTVDKSFADLGDVLTYTTSINNTGTIVANNVLFRDTTPTGTTYIDGSLTVSSSYTGTTPASGLVITSIPSGQIVTLSWQVRIGNTIPISNPIQNIATIQPSSGSSITTAPAQTQVNHADLTSSGNSNKQTNKLYSDINSTITYTIKLTNTGSTGANNVVITDSLPLGTTYVPNSLFINTMPSGSIPGIGIPVGTIPAGSTTTITFQVLVGNTIPTPNSITNQAAINYNYTVNPSNPNSKSVNTSTNQVSTTIQSGQPVTVVKSASRSLTSIGSTLTYTITFTNGGNIADTNVIITDTLPTGTSFIPGSVKIDGITQPAANPNLGITIGTVSAGQTRSTSFDVLIQNTVPNLLTNTATTSYQYQPDPNLAPIAPITLTTAPIQVNVLKLALNKTVDKSFADLGDTLTYTTAIINTGATTATQVIFQDTTPNGTSYVSDSLNTSVPVLGTDPQSGLTINTIPPGQTVTLSWQVTIGSTLPTPNPITNEARIQIPGLLSLYSSSVQTQVNHADLVSTGNTIKQVDQTISSTNQQITYTIQLTNTGNTSANNVLVTDSIPSGTTYVPNSLFVNNNPIGSNPDSGILIGTIPAGTTTTITFKVLVGNTIPNPNPVLNQALVDYSYTVNPAIPNSQSMHTATNQVSTFIQSSGLITATKSANQSITAPGDTFTYTIIFSNAGAIAATSVSITDLLPTGTTFIPGSVKIDGITSPNADPHSGIYIGTVSAGHISTTTFDVSVQNNAPSILTNTAEFLYTLVTPATIVTAPVQVGVIQLDVNKTVNQSFADLGDTLTYTAAIINTGATTATQVIFQDTTPTGTSYVSGSLNTSAPVLGTDPQSGLTINTITPGQTITLSWQVLIGNTLPTPNPITNLARVQIPGLVSIYSPSVQTQINHADLISTGNTTKQANLTTANLNQEILYTIQLKNTGNTNANNVFLIDSIPSGTTYISNSLLVNGVSNPNIPGDGILIGTIPAGTTTTVTFGVLVGNTLPTPNPVVNQALIGYTYTVNPLNPNSKSVNTSTNQVSTLIQSGNLVTASKSANRTLTTIGDSITYTVTFTNNGNIPDTNVIVLDPTSIGTSFIPGTVQIDGITQPNANPNLGILLGTVSAGQTKNTSFSMLVNSNASNTITNTATVFYSYLEALSAFALITNSIVTGSVQIPVQHPSISLTKSSNRTGVTLGDTITYSLTIKNTGDLPAENVTISDTLSSALQFANNVTLNGSSISGNIISGINIGNLGLNKTALLTFDAVVVSIPDAQEIINIATGIYQYRLTPQSPVLSGNTASQPYAISVYNPSLSVSKSASSANVQIGTPFTYVITITNNGNTSINDVTFTDSLPIGFTVQEIQLDQEIILGDLNLGINIGTLIVNQSRVVTLTILIDKTVTINEFINKVTVTGTSIIEPDVPPVLIKTTAQDPKGIHIYSGELLLYKSIDKAYAIVGDTVSYSIQASNEGNVPFSSVIISDLLPAELEFIQGSLTLDGILLPTANILSGINIGDLLVSQTKTIRFTARVLTYQDTPISNTALGQYTVTLNGESISTLNVMSNSCDLTAQIANLHIFPQVDEQQASINDTLSYTITLINTGNLIAYNTIFITQISSAVILLPGSFSINGKVVNGVELEKGVFIGNIPVGEKIVINYQVQVLSDTCNGLIINESQVKYSYHLADGSVGTQTNTSSSQDSTSSETKINLNVFKQLNVESYLTLTPAKPDMEMIDAVTGTVDIKKSHIITTTPNGSTEGQLLETYKVIIYGMLNLSITYTALDVTQSVHSAHYTVPFSTFIVLPSNYSVGSSLNLTALVEDISYRQLDTRNFFVNSPIFINSKPFN